MGFDLKKFQKTKFQDNTADVKVPELKAFFDEGEEPALTVRALTSLEIAKIEHDANDGAPVLAMLGKLMADSNKDKAEGIKEAIGLFDENAPAKYIQCLNKVAVGVTSVKLSKQDAVKLADCSPSAFYRLVNEINRLSGEGRVPGKPRPSTDAQT